MKRTPEQLLNHDAVWSYMPMIACLYCDMLLWTARTHGWHDWTDTSKTWVRAHTDRCAMRYLINLAPKGVTP